MRTEYNIYCDESCHLLNDKSKVMVLGALWCPKGLRKEIFERIREIKLEHKLNPKMEIKWNKVSKGAEAFYIDIINYFFDNRDLHFRALIIPDKTILNHKAKESHDDFYYDMYFSLLKTILSPHCAYNVYMDIKDTRSEDKVRKLQEYLRNTQYDFQHQIVKKIQLTHSHEVELLQLTDLFTGAICYVHRNLKSNPGKLKIIEKIKARSGYSLTQSTLYKEDKMNIFIWKSRNMSNGE